MIIRLVLIICLCSWVSGCKDIRNQEVHALSMPEPATPQVIILGTIQDAGSPQIACDRECCQALFKAPDPERMVVSLGLFDPATGNKYLFEATPDIPSQVKALKNFGLSDNEETPDGVFLTHAHIGHYTGLMYFGREAMNADHIPVYVMPLMKKYLELNGPWSQLVNLGNIDLLEMTHDEPLALSSMLKVTPFRVPHRDEFSETVGYHIAGPNKSLLFIPDIDKWHRWKKDIISEIEKVDYAFIDGSFFDARELDFRNMDDIPHPSLVESMEIFKNLPPREKDKIYFIHFNHTNPVLQKDSEARKTVLNAGFHLATFHQKIKL